MSDIPSFDPHRRFVVETGLAATIAGVVEPRIEALGFRLVRISVTGRNGSTVQVMAERPDGRITIGEIESISRDISPALDVLDPMAANYHLEVSSPGIDRPLVRPSDFEDWAGQEARIELKEPVDGHRRLRGRLEGFTDGEVRIAVSDLPGGAGPQVIGLPPALIVTARLVMTDELIREDLRRSKANIENSQTADGGDGQEEVETGHGPDRG
jgi:ribosome maturation factor RimP